MPPPPRALFSPLSILAPVLIEWRKIAITLIVGQRVKSPDNVNKSQSLIGVMLGVATAPVEFNRKLHRGLGLFGIQRFDSCDSRPTSNPPMSAAQAMTVRSTSILPKHKVRVFTNGTTSFCPSCVRAALAERVASLARGKST